MNRGKYSPGFFNRIFNFTKKNGIFREMPLKNYLEGAESIFLRHFTKSIFFCFTKSKTLKIFFVNLKNTVFFIKKKHTYFLPISQTLHEMIE